MWGVPNGSQPRSPSGLSPAELSPALCRRDLEDMRQEMCQERAKRQALQVSESLARGCPRAGVPTTPRHSQPLPAGGDRAGEEGAALLARAGAAVPIPLGWRVAHGAAGAVPVLCHVPPTAPSPVLHRSGRSAHPTLLCSLRRWGRATAPGCIDIG